MKAFEQYFHVVLFVVLHKVGSVNKTSMCEHLIEIHGAVYSCGTGYNAVQCGCNF